MSDKVKQSVTVADVAEMPAEIVRPTKAPRAEALRKQLEAERDKLQPELDKARDVYNAIVNDPKLLKARADIKRLSGLLAPVLNELASLARAGGAKGIQAEAGNYTKVQGA